MASMLKHLFWLRRYVLPIMAGTSMADPHVLTGLMAKCAEIAGKIEHLQDQLRQLVIDLDHIDASIHMSLCLIQLLNEMTVVSLGTAHCSNVIASRGVRTTSAVPARKEEC